MTKRIRRTAELPTFAVEELQQRRRYPIKLSLLDAKLVCRLGRRDLSDERVLFRREVFAWLLLGRERVGAFSFLEYSPRCAMDNQTFTSALDEYSSLELDLAQALCRQWGNVFFELLERGQIVLYENAWLARKHARGDLFATSSKRLIEALFPERSVLALKAFPLEYQGQVTRSNARAFGRRRRAMMRHYARLLGLRPMLGRAGIDGWMFAPHNCVLPDGRPHKVVPLPWYSGDP